MTLHGAVRPVTMHDTHARPRDHARPLRSLAKSRLPALRRQLVLDYVFAADRGSSRSASIWSRRYSTAASVVAAGAAGAGAGPAGDAAVHSRRATGRPLRPPAGDDAELLAGHCVVGRPAGGGAAATARLRGFTCCWAWERWAGRWAVLPGRRCCRSWFPPNCSPTRWPGTAPCSTSPRSRGRWSAAASSDMCESAGLGLLAFARCRAVVPAGRRGGNRLDPLSTQTRQPRASSPISWESVVAGIRFVWRTKLILATITLDLFAVLLGGATYLLPIYAKNILHVGAPGLGLLQAADAVGAICMAIVAGPPAAAATRRRRPCSGRSPASEPPRWSSDSRSGSGCRC